MNTTPESGFNLDLLDNIMRCPVCNNIPAYIYQCSDCGEVRCGNENCTGSFDESYRRWAAFGTGCRHCNTGHYRWLGFDSDEMATFLSEYSRPAAQNHAQM